MSDDADGFLSRWARRKARVQSGATEVAGVRSPEGEFAPSFAAGSPVTVPQGADDPSPVEVLQAPPPDAIVLPTMDDVARLTRASDYSRFVAPGVEPGVRNAAMKKLFSDPHFNVMDGLDTYIDDYGKPDPIPMAMLRQMNQAKFLGLFDDEDDEEGAAGAACPDGATPMPVAQSPSIPALPATLAAAPDVPSDDDPDLRLQQDNGAERPGLAPGPRA